MDDEGYRRDIVGCMHLSFKLRLVLVNYKIARRGKRTLGSASAIKFMGSLNSETLSLSLSLSLSAKRLFTRRRRIDLSRASSPS